MSRPPIHHLRRTIQRHTSNLYDTLFTRRLSIYFTVLLARFEIRPNTISLVALLVGLASCVMIGLASTPWIFIGVGLLHLHQILDSVDGELARLYRRPSIRGMFLEDLSAYLLINTYFLAFGVYLLRRDGDLWAFGASVLILAWGRNAMPVVRRVILLSLKQRAPKHTDHAEKASAMTSSASSQPPSQIPSKSTPGALTHLRHVIEEHLLHYTNVRVILSSVLVGEELLKLSRFHLLRGLLFFYLGLQMLKELGTIALYLRHQAIDDEIASLLEKPLAIHSDATHPETKK